MVSGFLSFARTEWRNAPIYLLILAMIGMHFWYTTSVQFAGIHIYVVDVAVLLVYLTASVHVLRGNRIVFGYIGLALGAFLMILLIGAAIGYHAGRPPRSIFNDLKTGFYLATCIPAATLIVRIRDLEHVVKFALIVVCAAAAYDVITRLGGPNYYPFDASASEVVLSTGVVSRAFGLVTAPPYYGVAIALVAACLTYWPLRRRGFACIAMIGVGLLGLELVLLLRGVYVGLLASGLVFLLFLIDGARYSRRALGRYAVIATVGALATAVAILAAYRFNPFRRIAERMLSIVDPSASTSHASATTSVRLDFIIGAGVDLVRHGQLIFGRGLGYSAADRTATLIGIEAFYPTLAYHSAAGWVLSKTGLVGSAVFLCFLAAFILRAFAVSRLELVPRGRALLVGSTMALTFLATTSLAENYLLQYPYAVPLAGLLLAVPEIINRCGTVTASDMEPARTTVAAPTSPVEPVASQQFS